MMRMAANDILRLCVFGLASAVASTGCRSANESTADSEVEHTGEANFALSVVPTGAQCLQVTTSGAGSVTLTAALVAGTGSSLVTIGRLPLGALTIKANVYDVAAPPSREPPPRGLPTIKRSPYVRVCRRT